MPVDTVKFDGMLVFRYGEVDGPSTDTKLGDVLGRGSLRPFFDRGVRDLAATSDWSCEGGAGLGTVFAAAYLNLRRSFLEAFATIPACSDYPVTSR
jgi:hypothetical protein